jgi:hypothetical protein
VGNAAFESGDPDPGTATAGMQQGSGCRRLCRHSKQVDAINSVLALETVERERLRQFSHNSGPGRRTVTGCPGGDAGERGEWEDE